MVSTIQLSGPLQFRNQVLEAIIADACALSHARCDNHVTYFERRIAHRRREARLAVLFAELGRHHGDAVGKLLENLGEHNPAWRRDLPVFAVERGLSLGMAIDEAPGATGAEIDFTDWDRVALAQPAPPLLHMFGFRHRLEHQSHRGIEQARHADFAIRRRRDFKALSICCAASYHESSSPLSSVVVRTRPIDQAALPRLAGSARS